MDATRESERKTPLRSSVARCSQFLLFKKWLERCQWWEAMLRSACGRQKARWLGISSTMQDPSVGGLVSNTIAVLVVRSYCLDQYNQARSR